MLIAEVPALAPVAIGAELTIALVVLVSAVLTLGLVKLFDYTIGLLLDMMAGLVPHIPFAGGIAKHKIEAIKHSIRNRMLSAAAHQFELAGRLFHGAESLVLWSADTVWWLAQKNYETMHALTHSWIPGLVTGHTKPLTHDLAHTKAAGEARARAEAKARTRGIDAVHRDTAQEKLARERGIDNVRAGSRAYADARIGRVHGEIAAEREYSHRVLRGELGFWERVTGYTAIGGIALATLTRVFPYWQCRNVRNFNRGLCRGDLSALEALLGGALLTLAALDVRLVAHLAQDAEQGLSEIVHKTAGL